MSDAFFVWADDWGALRSEIAMLPTHRPAELSDTDRSHPSLQWTWTLPRDPLLGRLKRWLKGVR